MFISFGGYPSLKFDRYFLDRVVSASFDYYTVSQYATEPTSPPVHMSHFLLHIESVRLAHLTKRCILKSNPNPKCLHKFS